MRTLMADELGYYASFRVKILFEKRIYSMLDFWALEKGESVNVENGVIEFEPNRKPEYSIEIEAFHRILDNGLKAVASDIGLSYFEDALIDETSSQRILDVLMEVDTRLNQSGNRTENRLLAEFFRNAVSRKRKVAVLCD